MNNNSMPNQIECDTPPLFSPPLKHGNPFKEINAEYFAITVTVDSYPPPSFQLIPLVATPNREGKRRSHASKDNCMAFRDK